MMERGSMFSQSFAATSLNVMNPHRSVIVDMIMVQILSAIITLALMLLLKGNEIGSTNASYLLVGLFGTLVFLSAVYSRITR
tara:strand:+ start:83 stop:328 length:246 start_codon:yes stop_codon:yes gene_type:complete